MARIRLSEGAWQQQPGFGPLCRTLGSDDGLVRMVGGAVRDGLAGQSIADIDFATPLSPDEVMTRLGKAGIKVVPTGLAHGTVTAVISATPYEITTLRRDVATDGRHAIVAYTDDWREDAARRDFTINALFADPLSREIFDYFDGVDDLAAGRVRFIGDPATRIAEDHLRILRFFRFHARYGRGEADGPSLAACTQRANDLMALSRERIADELLKTLALPDPAPIIGLMISQGIFRPVLPEITTAEPLGVLVAAEQSAAAAPDPVRRLAALFPADPVRAEQMAARLKLSNAIRKRLSSAAARTRDDAGNPFALAYRLGLQSARDRLLLGGGDARLLDEWQVPALPLGGGAIVARGVSAGPDVARLLKQVEEQWIGEGFPDAARTNAIADRIVAQSFSATTRSEE